MPIPGSIVCMVYAIFPTDPRRNLHTFADARRRAATYP
jgi:hypothetical protein